MPANDFTQQGHSIKYATKISQEHPVGIAQMSKNHEQEKIRWKNFLNWQKKKGK